MKKYKPTKKESEALKKFKSWIPDWKKLHPELKEQFEISEETVKRAVGKAFWDMSKKRIESKPYVQAVAKFVREVENLKK